MGEEKDVKEIRLRDVPASAYASLISAKHEEEKRLNRICNIEQGFILMAKVYEESKAAREMVKTQSND